MNRYWLDTPAAARASVPTPPPPPPESCECIDSLPLAFAYVPMQMWEEPYPDETALARGTIFPSLDLPTSNGTSKRREMGA